MMIFSKGKWVLLHVYLTCGIKFISKIIQHFEVITTLHPSSWTKGKNTWVKIEKGLISETNVSIPPDITTLALVSSGLSLTVRS